ncbi:MAG TPA: M56 family metallopeptidase [Mucilaginibacter sp.]|nr:M56 family metallopeptidase [Mucilaginibacter sp.]
MDIFDAPYLLLANACLVLFSVLYLLLRKKTFFQLNRIYLLSSILLSFLIPFIHATWVSGLSITRQVTQTIYLPGVTINGGVQGNATHLSLTQILAWLYIIGVVFMAAKLIARLIAVKRFIRQDQNTLSYSFFKKIHISQDNLSGGLVYAHENIHAAQWHSVDVLLAELVITFNWFNPAAYFIRRELKNVHEFIADSEALKATARKREYVMLLVSQTFETPINELVNTFFKPSLLKQRIMMIQKDRSQKKALLRYGFFIPLFAAMLILSSAAGNPFSKPGNMSPALKPQQKNTKVFTVVEHPPQFPGGTNEFMKFLGKNIHYPAVMREKNIQGQVLISFIVEKDGRLDDFKIAKDIGYGAGKEALRVLAMSPKWEPGIQNGHKVRTAFTVPINFALQKEN